VRFLIDECLSGDLASRLQDAGHDCGHVYEVGLGGQPDEEIMALAAREDRILISADTDFGEMLANPRARAQPDPPAPHRQAS
jgi:predicted nuclease of predicted toxin-antitoxin system